MVVFLKALLIGVALLHLSLPAQAQEPQKPSKDQEYLKRLVGSWSADSENGKGTMIYKMELGGLWLMGDFEGEFGGFKFQGKSLESYDSATKKYRSVWVDSFSTQPRIMEGDLDKEGKIMTLTGTGRGADQKTVNYKSVTEIKNDDTVNYSLFLVDKDGKELPMVKLTYKRKK
ncbi:DUF1579 domain-containing protein [Telmatocola sphagniphila]|uniref:DUF1579 domain-containing protein n=1 Tax=Telmatocola sphagniphila TaxID=1123043 RepID=A0A8E6B408_9BACT|nr:DUF1579 domain-containing protein [Telmatocola sphagniphila]QVL30711.1 DUF1579 domain-containing protein [Telmatocola sphagniphila]